MTEICKGENYKYTLVIDGKEHVLELYDIAKLLGFQGGPLEHGFKKFVRGGDTHKGQTQDLKESIDCINIAMTNPEYCKRGEKRFVLSKATERRTVIGALDVDINVNINTEIPEGTTHFITSNVGKVIGIFFYRIIEVNKSLRISDWNEKNSEWERAPHASIKNNYRPISELTGDNND